MGADFSRVRLNALLDYAGVELKQGGLFLDADANELMAIVDRRLRALASDTLGRATVSSTTPDAFKITASGTTLSIAKGRLYVDGLLAENHGGVSTDPTKRVFDDLLGEPAFQDAIDYGSQPYLPSPPPALPQAGRHLVYLDVWDREVTQLEDPNVVENAVGVETGSRVQTVWQVRVLADAAPGTVTCDSPDTDLPGWIDVIAPSTGVLSTGTFAVAPADDPCELPPTGGYRGLENQLYRVEIHDGGLPGATATFKWSRENASIGSRVTAIVSGTELELETLGRDDVLRFNVGDWVEITDDDREFSQSPGVMRRIATINEGTRRIQFAPAISGFSPAKHMRVRRWDQKGLVFRTDVSGTPVQVQDLDAAAPNGVIAVPGSGTTLLLEQGVTVSFDETGSPGFRAGDFWVFAARTADASVEILDRAPPRGIHHHYARLALWDVAAGAAPSCRTPWPPKGDGGDCGCSACVTEASHASNSFTLGMAVQQVRDTGGTICLGPGRYALTEPVRLLDAKHPIRIRGQGPATILVAPAGAFDLQNCIAPALENMTILSLGQVSAISVRTVFGLTLQGLVIAVLGVVDRAAAAAIALQGLVAAARITENVVFAPFGILANDPRAPQARDEKTPAFLLALGLAIEDNLMWCQHQAVTLSGLVFFGLEARVAGNEMFACDDTALSALGTSLPGSSVYIRNNTMTVSGSGIRCALDGAWIEGNKVFAAGGAGVGVAVTAGLGKSGIDQCQILGNQVSGFAQAGVQIDVPVRELIIKQNIIESCGNGILAIDRSSLGSVSIENNHVREIGPIGEARQAATVGIGVSGSHLATVAGNTIGAVGVNQPAWSIAIQTVGVQHARVRGNEAAAIGSDQLGSAAGILLRAPYTEVDVSHNHVRRETGSTDQNWHALLAVELTLKTPVSHLGTISTVRLDVARTLVLAGAQSFVSITPAAVPGTVSAGAHGLVQGNTFSARGSKPAVELLVAGECLFNDNRVELIGDAAAVVSLVTEVAIINANRVRSGAGVRSIQVQAGTVAALGNVTTGEIHTPAGPMPAPWNALNLIA